VVYHVLAFHSNEMDGVVRMPPRTVLLHLCRCHFATHRAIRRAGAGNTVRKFARRHEPIKLRQPLNLSWCCVHERINPGAYADLPPQDLADAQHLADVAVGCVAQGKAVAQHAFCITKA
jgi:hypothetical protein